MVDHNLQLKIEELQRQLSLMQDERTELLDEIDDLRLDIEDIQLENEDLREREALIRALIEQAPDAFFVHDLEGYFIFANEASCKAMGYSQEEVLKMKVQDVEYGKTPDEMLAVWKEVREGKTVHTEGLLKRKGGSTLPVDIRIGLFDASGNDVVYGIARDISERKKFEGRLRHSHKMEAVGTLAGGIAHDFNNILGIILGCAELGGDPLADNHPSHEYLDEIRLAVKRAKQVVQQLLSFSQKSDEEREPLLIEPLIKESLKLMRSTIPANIELYTSIGNDGFMVTANPAQIHQMIINLCTNAAHATRSGGSIHVSLKSREFVESSMQADGRHFQGKYLQLTVRDTGCGMEEGLLERIFDPYFTTKDIARGSGMGLSVVHGIVQSLNGVIKVVSQVGEGTTFDVFLPAIEPARQQGLDHDSGETLLPMGHERILVVDDEDAIVIGLKERLEALGYTVDGYTVSVQALEIIEERSDQYDLVITDMAMPKMTGEVLIEHIHKIRHDLPVILCTGFSERIDERQPQKMGADKILLKPITREELALAVREVLDAAKGGIHHEAD